MTVADAIRFLETMPPDALLLAGPWNYGPDCYEANEFDFRKGPVTVYPTRPDSPWYRDNHDRVYLGRRIQPADDKASYGSRTLKTDAQVDKPRIAVLFGYDKHVNESEISA